MTIELNDDQARLIARALETHSRTLCGQLEVSSLPALETALYRDPAVDEVFYLKRDAIDGYLSEIKKLAFPELSQHQSHGIGSFIEADLAYEMYKGILHHLEIKKMGEVQAKSGSYSLSLHSYLPLKLTGHPLLKIKE